VSTPGSCLGRRRAACPEASPSRRRSAGPASHRRPYALATSTTSTISASCRYAVKDHIKNLFEKTGVGSRQELVARIFLDDYMPQIARRAPLTSTGAFAE
jgi:hypothetical protein